MPAATLLRAPGAGRYREAATARPARRPDGSPRLFQREYVGAWIKFEHNWAGRLTSARPGSMSLVYQWDADIRCLARRRFNNPSPCRWGPGVLRSWWFAPVAAKGPPS